MGQGGSNQTPPPNPNPEQPWWLKFIARAVGAIGAILAMILGIMTIIGFSPICFAAGIIQILVGCLVIIFEAPCCCMFLDVTQPLANFADSRPYLQKGIIYFLIAIPALAMCFKWSTLLGSGLIMVAGVIYGLMSLGKKANREEMLTKAMRDGSQGDDVRINLVDNEAETNLDGPPK